MRWWAGEMRTKLKICGMKHSANITDVAALAPAYMGFIFYPKSERFVERMDAAVLESIPEGIKRTGVFVNESLEQMAVIVAKYHLHAVQLHGTEPADKVAGLKQVLPADVAVIKAFGIGPGFDFSKLDAYQPYVDYFLFDTQTPAHGGSGRRFDWTLLEGYLLDKPYFLSGGIGPESSDELLSITDERLYAIDVNSRFELEPGLKDVDKLRDFKNKLSL